MATLSDHVNTIMAKSNTRTVLVPGRREHDGISTVRVTLVWTCPTCGGPRGEVNHETRSYDGSRILYCDGWQNPCGHVDYYDDVRAEAAQNGLQS